MQGRLFEHWEILKPPPKNWNLDLTFLSGALPFYAQRLLYNRSISTVSAAREYILDTGTVSGLSNPHTLPGVKEGVLVIEKALKERSKIGVYGDFDADGVTASAILGNLFRTLGSEVCYYIPHREKDGHGVSIDGIKELIAQGVKLIITVDTGVTAFEEVAFANQRNVDVVITDHHTPKGQLPKASAIINHHLLENGRQGGLNFSGAGTAFKLAQALCEKFEVELPDELIALAAIGTIADRMPLVGENRTIVKLGIDAFATTAHRGLSALRDNLVPNIPGTDPKSAITISFYVCPAINAPGRLGSAKDALDLLLTNDDKDKAFDLVRRLSKTNQLRRKLSKKAESVVLDQIDEQATKSVLALDCEDSQIGVLGPLASRIAERFQKPVMAYVKKDGVVRASMRSVPGVDLFDAISQTGVSLERFGGHSGAAGLSVLQENLVPLLDALDTKIRWQSLGNESHKKNVLKIDCEVDLNLLGVSDWDFVRMMEPFGELNKEPIFFSRNVTLEEVGTFGLHSSHLKAKVSLSGRKFSVVGYRMGKLDIGNLSKGIAFKLRPSKRTSRGTNNNQIELVDFR